MSVFKLVFQCKKCGLCCQSLSRLEGYEDLDDGTGVCVHFDRANKLCRIYEHRPLKCNVEKSYQLYQHLMSYEEYVQANTEGCKILKGG